MLPQILSAITLRQRRMAILPPELQGEAAWDILLSLAEANYMGRSITIGGIGWAGDYSAGTRNRYLTKLAERGWVECSRDRRPGCRNWLSITNEGLNAVAACFGLGRPDRQFSPAPGVSPGGAIYAR